MITSEVMATTAARAADDKHASDILVLEVGALIGIVDHFVLASGESDRQLLAMADGVEDALRAHGLKPLRREGERDARWILLDYGDIVIHLFLREERAYYELERLWKDAPVIEWADVGASDRTEQGPLPADRREIPATIHD